MMLRSRSREQDEARLEAGAGVRGLHSVADESDRPIKARAAALTTVIVFLEPRVHIDCARSRRIREVPLYPAVVRTPFPCPRNGPFVVFVVDIQRGLS